MSELKTYKIPFAYERYGRIPVEAECLADAYALAEDKLEEMDSFEMHELSTYLEDSAEIDTEGLVTDEYGNIIEY